jgi:hypothetical protein
VLSFLPRRFRFPSKISSWVLWIDGFVWFSWVIYPQTANDQKNTMIRQTIRHLS